MKKQFLLKAVFLAIIQTGILFSCLPAGAAEKNGLQTQIQEQKDYFDYSAVLKEYPEYYYYTTIKINKSKHRILIVTDRVDENNYTYYGMLYYFAKNGFAYPLGYIASIKPLAQSKNYLYVNDKKVYISDGKFSVVESKNNNKKEKTNYIEFTTIESADKFAGDFGEAAGNDVVRESVEGFYFEYHKPDYKKEYINKLMHECINEGVKTNVQMYCCMVNKLHP